VSEIPGVERAAIIDELPLTKDGGTVHVVVFGQPTRPGEEYETVIRSAGAGYFETMGIPVVGGRTFENTDTLANKRIVLLNETLARILFNHVDPVGRRLVMPFNKSDWEIVGVVGDVHLADLDRAARPTLYTFAPQDPSRSSTLVFRSATGVDRLASAVSAELQRIDPSLPIYAARSIEDTIRLTPGVATRRLVLYLIGAFSVIGTLMAGIGLFGLMSFLVVQRSKEIGIRMALGAAPGTVRRLVLTQAMTMTGLGLAAGIIIAVASSRFIQGVIFGVTPSTPSVLAIVCVLVSAITFVACYNPIRRATHVDPVVVLRND
jgi:predicted permease